MLLDLSPLKKYRDYRLLFFGQIISFLGSMVSYVAVPYQVFELTHDNATVGLMGVVQLVPVLVFGILGGTYADRLDRRKLLLVSEVLMTFTVFGLFLNSCRETPSVPMIFALVAILQAVLGFHRPAMEAITQVMIRAEDYAAVGALGGFRYSFGAIAGPALGGVVIASFGVKGAYLIDVLSFGASFLAIYFIRSIPPKEASGKSPLLEAREGLMYALSKPELIGTYLIDIVAMLFAFPVALFPAMSQDWGGAKAAGILFSAMAIGSLVMTLLSGWTSKVALQGRGVVIAAALWGVAIVALGFAPNLLLAALCLGCAGAADMVSGLFRGVIWNQSVPNVLRGRLSGIEMISYMSGPLLGNARAGLMAAKFSIKTSLVSGGIVCVLAVALTAFLLPSLWRYEGTTKQTTN